MTLSKSNIVGSLCIGLLYLWFVAIAQILNGSILSLTEKRKERKLEEVSDAFTDPKQAAYQQYEEELHNNDPQSLNRAEIYRKFQSYFSMIKAYSDLVFWLPILLLNATILLKYNGIGKAINTIINVLG